MIVNKQNVTMRRMQMIDEAKVSKRSIPGSSPVFEQAILSMVKSMTTSNL